MNTAVTDAPTEQAQASAIRFFDAGSRIGRARYLAYAWGVLLLILPVAIVAGIALAMHMTVIGGLLFLAIEVFALVMSGVFIVRRLHDFNRSGWWSLIYWGLQVWSFVLTFQQALSDPFGGRSGTGWLVTVLILMYLLALLLVPGTRGANRFGPMPPPNSTWVVIGAWAFLLIPILGILAAIAIPAYQDYIARSQTSEGIRLAGGAEAGLAEYYQQHKSWPDKLESVYPAAGQDPAGRFVESVSGHSTDAQTYGVVSTMKSTGVNRMVADKSLEIWTTDGGNTWHCGPGGADPLDKKFLPAGCRDADAP